MLPFLLFVRALLLPFLVLLLLSLGSQAAVSSVALSFSFFTFFQCFLLCAFYSFLFCTFFCTMLLYNFFFHFSYSRILIILLTSFATVLHATPTTSLATTTNLFSYLPCLLAICAFFLLLFFHTFCYYSFFYSC